jgi:shikimate dehydrogenase
MKKACVIGWPISHSRSPLIHNYWLKLYGIAGSYERIPVEPAKLAAFLNGLAEAGFSGCNVTLPHKEAAFRLVETADENTRRLGVVNTVFLKSGKLLGTSTDGEGFIANLNSKAPQLKLKNQKAVVLGAGGAAMAIIGALQGEGVAEIILANRTFDRSKLLCRKFGDNITPVNWSDRGTVLSEATLLVNTTSLGMTGQPLLEISLRKLPATAVVTDVIYSPLETPLLQQAKQLGLTAVGGLGMLLHQAIRGFELWFGMRPAVTPALYNLVAKDIDTGYRP